MHGVTHRPCAGALGSRRAPCCPARGVPTARRSAPRAAGERAAANTAAAAGPPEAQAASTSASTEPLDEAWKLLREFTLAEFKRAATDRYLGTAADRQRLRSALLRVYSTPHAASGWLGPAGPEAEVLLGVVASDVRFAARAYRDWCEALGLPLVAPSSRVDGVVSAMDVRGGVYLKYSSRTQLCYVSCYDGRDRGVLIQLGLLQLGHFPLGFFDEAMAKPPPAF